MDRRRWDAWYEGVFDAMEAAARAYARGERLPEEDLAMFWDWARDSFQRQAQQAAQEVLQQFADDAIPGWDAETWQALGQRSYVRGYAWALHVELLRLNLGCGGVTSEDREAYEQARGALMDDDKGEKTHEITDERDKESRRVTRQTAARRADDAGALRQ